jgi:hypothetical protein
VQREALRQAEHFFRLYCTSRFLRPTLRTAKVKTVTGRKRSLRCPILSRYVFSFQMGIQKAIV